MNEIGSAPASRGPNGADNETSSIARRLPNPLDVRPAQPPGRRSRKVRAYAEQIRQLHAQGYSIEVIREALADVGVIASWSTVQREAARPSAVPGHTTPDHQNGGTSPAARALPPSEVLSDAPQISAEVRGKDFAEAFMNSRVNNPLLRKGKR